MVEQLPEETVQVIAHQEVQRQGIILIQELPEAVLQEVRVIEALLEVVEVAHTEVHQDGVAPEDQATAGLLAVVEVLEALEEALEEADLLEEEVQDEAVVDADNIQSKS